MTIHTSHNSVAPIDPARIDAVAAPFGISRTMPAEAYRSQELFDWEAEHIFSKAWTCLGRVERLVGPGQLRGIDHGSEGILLSRDETGEVRAFSNVCRHRGHLLVEPGDPIDARQIRCPYHSWAYRLDGELRSAPSLTQTPDFDHQAWGLVPIRAQVWMGWLFVTLDDDAPSLQASVGNLANLLAPYEPERLVTAAGHTYEIAANWKLVVENYHECYHCTTIHPELCQVTPPDSGLDHHPDGLWCGGTMTLKDHAVTMSLTGRSDAVFFRNLTPKERRTIIYVGLWPNLLISAHPDYVMTHRIVPMAPDRTYVECDWLFSPESVAIDDFDPAFATDFWDITNREDWTACEQVQRATANRGFLPGPLSLWESTIYQFLNMVAQAYRGERITPPVVPTRSIYKPING